MSPDLANAIHPQSQRVVLDTLTDQRFSRREASVNFHPKNHFFSMKSLCFQLGLLWNTIFVVSHFPSHFP